MHRLSHMSFKAVALAGYAVLSLVVLACAGPQGLQGAPGPQGPAGPAGAAAPQSQAAIALSASVIDTAASSITIYGSGFALGKVVDIRLVGTWKAGTTVDVTDPSIATLEPNQYGAFSVAVALTGSSGAFGYLGVGAGAYSIKAVQRDGAVAVAPLVVTQAVAKK